MFFSSTLIATLALAASASAGPVRRTTTACAPFFNAGVDTVKEFTLLASYDSNTTAPYEQLVLRPHGPTTLVSRLATASTIPDPVGSQFTMVSSGITTVNSTFRFASNHVDSGNALLTWTDSATQAPVAEYCEAVSTSAHGSPWPYPVLAVNGDADNFFICKASDGPEELVIYNVIQASATDYDFNTCQKVHILLQQPE